ncbi:MAG: 16S rRNA (cytosine(967)-C(5))-methyltransferase RsmB [Desulfobacterales bacterium]|nr:16S rRNA (cytosine(967)-C(5))-methyltransferase RsmB [Desulfobacterales bacterium]
MSKANTMRASGGLAGNPRKTALLILTRLDHARKTLDYTYDEVLSESPQFSRQDRVLLNALVFGVLRWRGRIDWIIKQFSMVPAQKIDAKILNILRLGAFQILFLDRIPSSAAVNTSVEMSKEFAAPWVVKFVNGLLRNIARRQDAIVFPPTEKNPAFALAVKKSFPEWLIKKWLQRFGQLETEALCDILNTIPPITVRVNTLKTSRNEVMTSLEKSVGRMTPAVFSPDGVHFYSPQAPISDINPFKAGGFQVQDEAAQLVSLFMAPEPGDRALDACAGLGGKTGHIGQLMKNQGLILALDANQTKLSRLDAEMNRLGISIVEPLRFNLNTPLPRERFGLFDKILLDAPCSGLGILRRKPDIKWTLFQKHLTVYKERQLKFLENLSHAVAHSGVLIYAVCSMEPEENEDVANIFLSRHPDFALDDAPLQNYAELKPFIQPPGYFRTFPHRHDMDGFFAARFKKVK